MASGFVTRSLGSASTRVPGLRHIPVVRLLMAAEIALLAHDHLVRLTPAERRRLVTLVRVGRGRRSRLTVVERHELEELVGKLQPRAFVGGTVHRLSPVPIPRRLLYGPRRSR